MGVVLAAMDLRPAGFPCGGLGVNGVMLLLLQAALYFGTMVAIFRARGSLGIGVFVCALGVMHFLETYLAAVFFIELPFGLISPGSTVLFSGKLAMVLLLYIKEDAEAVRQPVYGLLIGNMLIVAMCLLLRFHEPVALGTTRPDIGFIDQIGVLMVWGTLLLFVDSIMLVLLYERAGRWFGRHITARIIFCTAVVLSFDQLSFFAVLRPMTGVPLAALFGGWAAKMGAALVFGLMLGAYLRFFEAQGGAGERRRLADLFDLLTYRHRQAALLREAGRDAATGALASRHLAALGAERLRRAQANGRPLGLMMLEVARAPGGAAVPMREVAEALARMLRADDLVFRHGPLRFVLLLDGMPAEAAQALAEWLRSRLHQMVLREERVPGPGWLVRVGVAAGPDGAEDFAALLRRAEAGLWQEEREPGSGGAAAAMATPA
ncbi:MAG TPA: GGDEF domain-containing protein [Roseomonas sp.]|jgi:GGDEF domain-containing protein